MKVLFCQLGAVKALLQKTAQPARPPATPGPGCEFKVVEHWWDGGMTQSQHRLLKKNRTSKMTNNCMKEKCDSSADGLERSARDEQQQSDRTQQLFHSPPQN
jgi:hypothetical protein